MRTALDIIIAPRDAFARLREAPSWVWAYGIVAVISIFVTFLIMPALSHAMQVGLPAQLAANPNIAKLPPAEQQTQIARMTSMQMNILKYSWIVPVITVAVVAVVQALVMFIASKIGNGDATFKQMWCLAVNVQVAGAVGGLVLAAIVLLRGSDSFDRVEQVTTVLPSLALLVPGGSRVLVAFLSSVNVAGIWQMVLLALGMIAVGRVSKPVAWTAAAIMLLSLGVFAAMGAAAQGSAG